MISEPYASLYIDRNVGGYAVGIAMSEPYGMKGWLCEIPSDPAHPYAVIDRALHLLFVIGCSRVIVGASEERYFEEIKANFSLFECRYVTSCFESEEQNRLFREAFAIESLLTPIEHLSLEQRPLCAQALSLLAQELLLSREGGPYAVPSILDTSLLMELGNNALEQLEMISPDSKMPSVSKVVLSMSTPMGKRLGRFRLFLPIRDAVELERRYDWIEAARPHAQWLREHLREIGDIELLWWQCQNRKASDENVSQLLDAIDRITLIRDYLIRHKVALLMPEESLFEGWEDAIRSYARRQWLSERTPRIHALCGWIARLDVAVESARNAQTYGLTRPTIVGDAKEAFFQAMGLRHLLVELQGVAYVPNDIVMGQRDYLDLPYPQTVMLDPRVHDGANVRGVLLYGINSSGKSSLMKSIGISAVLAQAGFFVPARSMKFALFEGVYTRIMSRDNVAKSLSTFGVEMLELNTIFSRASERSLVLGDEISHGTETLSAVAIVASTIIELQRRGALFLMTTHLHQLSMIPELSRLREVVSLHLSVRYDEPSDRLVYDRILKPGRGSSVYGLEFAESLHMDRCFLDNAKRLREHLAKEYDVLELAHQKEYIKRYREVSACECVICGTLIRNPKTAGTGGTHHNLIPLCEKDRARIAEGKIKPRGLIMTPQGLRLEYETQL